MATPRRESLRELLDEGDVEALGGRSSRSESISGSGISPSKSRSGSAKQTSAKPSLFSVEDDEDEELFGFKPKSATPTTPKVPQASGRPSDPLFALLDVVPPATSKATTPVQSKFKLQSKTSLFDADDDDDDLFKPTPKPSVPSSTSSPSVPSVSLKIDPPVAANVPTPSPKAAPVAAPAAATTVTTTVNVTPAPVKTTQLEPEEDDDDIFKEKYTVVSTPSSVPQSATKSGGLFDFDDDDDELSSLPAKPAIVQESKAAPSLAELPTSTDSGVVVVEASTSDKSNVSVEPVPATVPTNEVHQEEPAAAAPVETVEDLPSSNKAEVTATSVVETVPEATVVPTALPEVTPTTIVQPTQQPDTTTAPTTSKPINEAVADVPSKPTNENPSSTQKPKSLLVDDDDDDLFFLKSTPVPAVTKSIFATPAVLFDDELAQTKVPAVKQEQQVVSETTSAEVSVVEPTPKEKKKPAPLKSKPTDVPPPSQTKKAVQPAEPVAPPVVPVAQAATAANTEPQLVTEEVSVKPSSQPIPEPVKEEEEQHQQPVEQVKQEIKDEPKQQETVETPAVVPVTTVEEEEAKLPVQQVQPPAAATNVTSDPRVQSTLAQESIDDDSIPLILGLAKTAPAKPTPPVAPKLYDLALAGEDAPEDVFLSSSAVPAAAAAATAAATSTSSNKPASAKPALIKAKPNLPPKPAPSSSSSSTVEADIFSDVKSSRSASVAAASAKGTASTSSPSKKPSAPPTAAATAATASAISTPPPPSLATITPPLTTTSAVNLEALSTQQQADIARLQRELEREKAERGRDIRVIKEELDLEKKAHEQTKKSLSTASTENVKLKAQVQAFIQAQDDSATLSSLRQEYEAKLAEADQRRLREIASLNEASVAAADRERQLRNELNAAQTALNELQKKASLLEESIRKKEAESTSNDQLPSKEQAQVQAKAKPAPTSKKPSAPSIVPSAPSIVPSSSSAADTVTPPLPRETPVSRGGRPSTRPKSALFDQFEKSGIIMGMAAPIKKRSESELAVENLSSSSSTSLNESNGNGSTTSVDVAAAAPTDNVNDGEDEVVADEDNATTTTTTTDGAKPTPKNPRLLGTFPRSHGPKRRPPSKASSMQLKGQDALLFWLQERTEGYAGVKVDNFTSSWTDGLAICALFHSFRPDLIPFDTLTADDKAKNFQLAFDAGETLGVARLIDVEDMLLLKVPDKQVMLTYLSVAFQTLRSAW